MNILLIAGRLPSTPWSVSGTVRLLARGLNARGHAVTIACQGVDDEEWFQSTPVIARAPYEQNGSDWSPGFASWARRLVEAREPDVTLSVARSAWGDVWMPLEPSAAAWMGGVLESLGPVGLGKALYKHTGALAACGVEARRPWPRGPGGARPRRIAVIGAAARDAARATLAAHRLETRVVALPFFSACRVPDQVARERARRALRSTLGARDEDVLALASCTGHVSPGIAAFLEALGRVNGRGTGSARAARAGRVLAVVLARDSYHAHDDAVRTGCAEWVRVVGTTARIEQALAACDVACVPELSSADEFAAGRSGRFAADALRMARPLLIHAHAAGAELVLPRPGLGEPGAVVRHDGVEPIEAVWARALAKAAEGPWRDRAMLAAAAAGEQLGEHEFLDALEETLGAAAEEARRSEGGAAEGGARRVSRGGARSG